MILFKAYLFVGTLFSLYVLLSMQHHQNIKEIGDSLNKLKNNIWLSIKMFAVLTVFWLPILIVAIFKQ